MTETDTPTKQKRPYTKNEVAKAYGDKVNAIVRQRIREIRQSKNMTLEALGLRAGATSPNNMNLIESGRYGGVGLGVLYAVASALGIEATDLLPLMAEIVPASDSKSKSSKAASKSKSRK